MKFHTLQLRSFLHQIVGVYVMPKLFFPLAMLNWTATCSLLLPLLLLRHWTYTRHSQQLYSSRFCVLMRMRVNIRIITDKDGARSVYDLLCFFLMSKSVIPFPPTLQVPTPTCKVAAVKLQHR